MNFFGRMFRNPSADELIIDSDDSKNDHSATPGDWCENSHKATLVTSRWMGTDLHAMVIDLDVEHEYVASTRPGHGHLYINHVVTFEAMVEIFEVLTKHGVMEEGFLKATKARGWASVRTPWTRKKSKAHE